MRAPAVAALCIGLGTLGTLALGTLALGTQAQASCFIVGDSIALGLSRVMRECQVNAKGGLRSDEIAGLAVQPADITIVSSGSNDPRNPDLSSNLEATRGRIAGRTIWILPKNPVARSAVSSMAAKRNDRTVAFTPLPNNKHPQSYQEIADAVRPMIR
jgi:hypothetical protein